MISWRVIAVLVAVLLGFVVAALSIRGGENSPPPHDEKRAPGDLRTAAVRTATRFLAAMDARTLLDAHARRELVARSASRAAERSLQRLYDEEAARLAQLRGGYSRAAMVGYRVVDLGTASAEVCVWAVSLSSIGDLPAAVGWRTLSVGLTSENGGWKIARVREVPGPTPESRPAALRRAARRFKEYRVAP